MKAKTMIAAALCVTMLAGCSSAPAQDPAEKTKTNNYGTTYPLQSDQTLTYWIDIPSNQDYKSFREWPFYKTLMEKTGVNLDMTFVTAGQGVEAFNLLMASGDLPDMIGYQWTGALGGPAKYIKENYILPLKDVIDTYSPNLKAYLAKDTDADRMIKTDDGEYYGYPFIRGDEKLTTYRGAIARKDYLDRAGITQPPEKISEWETALTKFKEMGVESPLCIGSDLLLFSCGFDAWHDYYVENGKVIYGRAMPEFKDFLTTMNRWYSQGLIESDIGTVDANIISTKMTSGKGGISTGTGGSLGGWTVSGKVSDPNYELIGLKYPSKNQGEISKFGFMENRYSGFATAISNNCKDVELAAKFLDYAYGEEGHNYYNFGEEGKCYTMVDGYPTYTQEMFDYKAGDLGAALNSYIGSVGVNSCVQDYRMYEQRMQSQEQKDAIENWSKTDMAKHLLPPVLPTAEESQEISQLNNTVSTYADEMFYKFVTGTESLDKFDQYVENLNNMGLNRVLELKQLSYDRYQSR